MLQYKYWFLLLQEYKNQLQTTGLVLDEEGFCYLPVKKVSEYLGYIPSIRDMRRDLEALRQEPIIINYLEKDGKPAIHGIGFLSEWRVNSRYIGFVLPSFLKNVLMMKETSNKLFAILNWDILCSFSGKYEVIIYKLCKDYLAEGQTPIFDLDDWRDYIGLNRQRTRYLRDHRGRPAYPLLPMFKAVLPGQWHSLSDPELEHSPITRIDFNLFCRFDELSIPDHSTLCRYRNRRRKTTPCPNCWN